MTHALIQNGVVTRLLDDAEPGLALFVADGHAVDVTGMESVAVGTTVTADGNFQAAISVEPSAADLAAYLGLAHERLLAAGIEVNVAATGAPGKPVLCDGIASTRADLALLALYGQGNPVGTKTWDDNDGVSSVLTGTELVTLATLVGTWISETYATRVAIRARIGAPAAPISTFAAIDAAFAS